MLPMTSRASLDTRRRRLWTKPTVCGDLPLRSMPYNHLLLTWIDCQGHIARIERVSLLAARLGIQRRPHAPAKLAIPHSTNRHNSQDH